MSYEDLDVYKLSLELAIDIYSFTAEFPKAEAFGLTSQIRRAAVSISCNLAEGSARNSPKEFNQFVGISRGSCSELLTLLEISERIGFESRDPELRQKVSSIAKMLTGLSKSLKTKINADD
jgi:four helix bundle protein